MTEEELIKRLRSGVQDEDYLFGDDPAITETEDIMRDAADRIEQLNAKLEETNTYATELEVDRRKTYEALLLVSRLHGEVDGQLDRAECLLTDAMVQLKEGKIKTRRNRADLIRKFLNDIRGQQNE